MGFHLTREVVVNGLFVLVLLGLAVALALLLPSMLPRRASWAKRC